MDDGNATSTYEAPETACTQKETEAASGQYTVYQSNPRQASKPWRAGIEVATTDFYWF